jgi:hypothetical protein
MGEDLQDSLAMLDELGITIPGPAYWIGILLFSVIGMVAFWKGRKRRNKGVKWTGLALMLYPYVIWGTVPMYVVGVALCGLAWWYWRKGPPVQK